MTRAATPKVACNEEAPSLDILVDEHYEYLYRYAHRYFRSADKAEELVQETFLAATTALKRFEGGSSPRTWLTSILRHKIMDAMRVKNREQPMDVEALDNKDLDLFDEVGHWRMDSGPSNWGRSPDSLLKEREFLTILQSCLGKLPQSVRQVFLLREMEGYAREEISENLQLTSSNVGVILHRARLSLQRCLQTNWFQSTPLKGES